MPVSLGATSSAAQAEAKRCQGDAFGGRRFLTELLVASGRHDEAAFTRLYLLTSPWIYHLLRHRTRSTAEAEDAMCFFYTALWKRAASGAPPNQSVLAWMTTLAYDSVKS